MRMKLIGALALCATVFTPVTMAQDSLLIQTRVVGGTSVGIDAVPSTAALLNPMSITEGASYGESQFCGGTVIAERWVLTAAHCLYGPESELLEPMDVSVLMGAVDLDSPVNEPIDVLRIIVHEEYVPETTGYDIALLELGMEAFSPAIALDAAPVVDDELAFIAGWGAISDRNADGQDFDTRLRGGFLRMIPAVVCMSRYPAYSDFVLGSEVCADRETNHVDACQGDSGGPLYRVSLSGGYVRSIAGITSWGVGCGLDGLPGVYTRVGAYVPWILDHAEGAVLDTGAGQDIAPVLLDLLPNINDTRELGRLEELGVGSLSAWGILFFGLGFLFRLRVEGRTTP